MAETPQMTSLGDPRSQRNSESGKSVWSELRVKERAAGETDAKLLHLAWASSFREGLNVAWWSSLVTGPYAMEDHTEAVEMRAYENRVMCLSVAKKQM